MMLKVHQCCPNKRCNIVVSQGQKVNRSLVFQHDVWKDMKFLTVIIFMTDG